MNTVTCIFKGSAFSLPPAPCIVRSSYVHEIWRVCNQGIATGQGIPQGSSSPTSPANLLIRRPNSRSRSRNLLVLGQYVWQWSDGGDTLRSHNGISHHNTTKASISSNSPTVKGMENRLTCGLICL